MGILRHLHLFGPRDATGSFGWSLGMGTHEISTWADLVCWFIRRSSSKLLIIYASNTRATQVQKPNQSGAFSSAC